MVFNHILVPLDGSRPAERALAHAGSIAHALGAQVLLLRVLDTQSSMLEKCPDSMDWRLRKLEAVRYMRSAARNDALDGLDVAWHLAEGRPAEQIMQFIRTHNVDLVVLNAHGQGGAYEFPFGGTAQKIVSAAGISCIILRDGDRALSDQAHYRKILVPLDGSRRAEWAVKVVCGMTAGACEEVVLLHVVSPPEMPRSRPLTSAEISLRDRLVECNRRTAGAYLSEIRSNQCANQAVRTRLVVSGRIAQTILDAAAAEDADLIVMTAHEDEGEASRDHNSVCQNVLTRSKHPVLVLQKDGGRSSYPMQTRAVEQPGREFISPHLPPRAL